LETNAQLDVNRVEEEVQRVVAGNALTVDTGPFFARLSFEERREGWNTARLQLYIGKRPYDENKVWEPTDALLSANPEAPLAGLFRENARLGLLGPIQVKFLKHVDPTKSTITVQAFTDESRGSNYNWLFMWARLRAAERANELVKSFYTPQQDEGGDNALLFC
jgi:hypothetical protein